VRLSSVLAASALVGAIVAACGGGPVALTPTPETTPAVTPSPEPTAAPSLPVAILDPSMTAEQLFDDHVPAADLNFEERSREPLDQAVIRDVQYTGADGQPVPAFLVAPANGQSRGAVLFLHWLGDDFSSRDEFVDEAVGLAAQGVESLLITQHFPWSERPIGVDHDRVAIGLQVRSIRRALTLLADEVGRVRIALVGHDYGAMYGILTASADDRVAALACMTPDSTWQNWFVQYFHVVAAGDVAGYAQSMADLDPVSRIAIVKPPVLLQFGTSDVYVSGADATTLANAAPGGTLLHRYDVGHRLDRQARDDRDAWLLRQLGIPQPSPTP
jgi:pimeloyl-ACP methyl ester carboxylesterase